MNPDTTPTPCALWKFFPDAQMIGTTRWPQNGGEAYSLGTGLADRLNKYEAENQDLLDSVACVVSETVTLEKELAEKTNEVARLREELDRFKRGCQGSCYACEPVGEMNLKLEAEVARLRELLNRAIEIAESSTDAHSCTCSACMKDNHALDKLKAEAGLAPAPKRTIYIAGPMRGYPEYNFPAFYAAEQELKADGWNVLSPARADNEHGFDEKREQEISKEMMIEFVKRDVDMISRCDAIYMLNGWSRSRGACAEKAIAEWLGLEVFYQARSGQFVKNPSPNS